MLLYAPAGYISVQSWRPCLPLNKPRMSFRYYPWYLACRNSELFIALYFLFITYEDFRFSLFIVTSCNFLYGPSVSIVGAENFLNWKDAIWVYFVKLGFSLPAEQGHSLWWNFFFSFLISLKQHAPIRNWITCFRAITFDFVWIEYGFLLRQAMCNLLKTVFQFCFLSLFKGLCCPVITIIFLGHIASFIYYQFVVQ